MNSETLVIISKKDFINNEIEIKFLKHFINYINARPHSEQKLLLIDNHDSHETSEFLNLANKNYILPYPLIAYLTHCMQSLDIGVFQPYKYWHDIVVQDALAGLSFEYDIRSFLRDLPTIRANTFKKRTIWHAFKKSGMWPISTKQCLKQLKTFNPPRKSSENNESTLPILL